MEQIAVVTTSTNMAGKVGIFLCIMGIMLKEPGKHTHTHTHT